MYMKYIPMMSGPAYLNDYNEAYFCIPISLHISSFKCDDVYIFIYRLTNLRFLLQQV